MKSNLLNTAWVGMLFFASLSCGLPEEVVPERDLFVKYYGDAGADRGVDLIPYRDGYVLFGTTSSSLFLIEQREGNESDLYLVFVDSGGNQVRAYAYDNQTPDVEGAVQDEAVAIVHTAEDDFLLLGTTTYEVTFNDGTLGAQRDVLLIKVDAAGVVIFQKVYGEQLLQRGDDRNEEVINEEAAGIVEVSDGYVMLITTSLVNPQKPLPYDPVADRSDVELIKITKDASAIIWQKKYGYGGTDIALSLVNGDGDDVVILAQTDRLAESVAVDGVQFGGGGKNVLVVVANQDGSEKQVRVFGSEGDEYPTRIKKLSGNQYVVVGSYGEGASMRSFYYQLAGTTLTEAAYGIGELPNRAADIASSYSPLSYWVAGYVANYSKNGVARRSEMFLSLVSRQASAASEGMGSDRLYGGNEADVINRIIRLDDGGLLLFGTIGFEGGSTMMCLMKTNKYGTYETE